jgi:hypothetical protein
MEDVHYIIIREFYRFQTANRSGIPYMNHIDEGLVILKHLEARQVTKQAWCIHPVVQSNENMRREIFDFKLAGANSAAIVLAMEYRHTANSYLSHHRVDDIPRKLLFDLRDKLRNFEMLRHMLIADKIQNYKDFQANEKLYENAYVLNEYFLDWIFTILELTSDEYHEYTDLIRNNNVYATEERSTTGPQK